VDLRLARLALCVSLAFLAVAPSTALAQRSPGSTGSDYTETTTTTSAGQPAISQTRAARIAQRDPAVLETRDRYGPLSHTVVDNQGRWQVSFFANDVERAQVIVDRASGEVLEAWTGYQVAWQMARGYSGQFGHKLNAPYVWIPLCLVFLLGLVDWRRPWRVAHLDLVVLLSFGISHIWFNTGDIGVSVPLVYPPLAYLLIRTLWVGFGRRSAALSPSVPVSWLAVATVFLVVFRITLNVADSGVIDVGYAGVIGADRIAHGEPIYGSFPPDNPFGDTYGPANYFPYVPFELAMPWHGSWDQLPAAHGAAILFDLATLAGLLLLGRRLRSGRAGRDLGVVLAFAWASFPYTAFALQSNSNDSLVAAFVVWALVAFARPLARGVLLGLATMTKFAPLALAPLFATGEDGLRGRPSWRGIALCLFGLALAGWLMLIHPLIDPGLGTFWDRTVASQIDRDSPFSIWGQVDLGPGQVIAQGLVAAFALLLAFVPRRRDLAQIAALAAAVLIAIQLTADHWFYLYIPWFFPLVLAGLFRPSPPLGRSTE
jgi:glycosyl transferase family 87